MLKYFTLLLFALMATDAKSQTNGKLSPTSNYTPSQKRLLILSTGNFIDFITQGKIDRDSVLQMACRLNSLPLLSIYPELYNIDSSTIGRDLINAGKIAEANRLLNQLNGIKRVQLLHNLAAWYIYKTGKNQADLDTARKYIQDGLLQANGIGDSSYRYNLLRLQAEYFYQNGQQAESKSVLMQIILSAQAQRNFKVAADTWQQLGTMQIETDSIRVAYFNNAIASCRQLTLKEKEIEILYQLLGIYLRSNSKLAQNDVEQILRLQQTTGYNHSLYAEYVLSFINLKRADYFAALNHANLAVKNMEWSGLADIQGTFYMRLGATYGAWGKEDEALNYYKKGLGNKSQSTHIFWFKSLLYATTLLARLHRYSESFGMIQETTSQFPPVTQWEKAQILSIEGLCYNKMGNIQMADRTYRRFLDLIGHNPDIDPNGEFQETYIEIAYFYVTRSDFRMARKVIGKVDTNDEDLSVGNLTDKNYILFKLDSADGNYKSAINYYTRHKMYYDIDERIEQKAKFDELNIKYGTEKKNKDILSLEKEKKLQTTTRNWILGALFLLLIIVALLVYNARLKQRTNTRLKMQQFEIGKQNNILQHLVTEKDWLVKEIHHRVKNNLHTVISLLGTQSGYLKNDIAINAITDSQRRIQSMSLIHQRLYQSNNLSAIRMTDYIHELVNSLSDSFIGENDVRFNLDIEPVELDLAHCIPLGLILNEAITNSFKYAFTPGDRSAINISLTKSSENTFLLIIDDNGKGLPDGFDATRSDSMGMNLMRGLSVELGATFSIKSHNGTRIEINFKYDQEINAVSAPSNFEETVES